MKSLLLLMPYLRIYRGTIIFSLLFALVMAATNSVVPHFSKRISDDLFVKGDQTLKYLLPLSLVLIFIMPVFDIINSIRPSKSVRKIFDPIFFKFSKVD